MEPDDAKLICEHRHTDRCHPNSKSHFEYCEDCGAVRIWTWTARGAEPGDWHTCEACRLPKGEAQ